MSVTLMIQWIKQMIEMSILRKNTGKNETWQTAEMCNVTNIKYRFQREKVCGVATYREYERSRKICGGNININTYIT